MKRFLPLFLLFTVLLAARAARAQDPAGTVVATYSFAPAKVLADSTRDRVYAVVPADNTLRVLDTTNLTSDMSIALPVGSIPIDLAISPDATRLYIANSGSTINAISVVDLTTLTVLPSIALPGPGLGVSTAPNNIIYVLSTVSTIVNTSSGPTVVVTYPIFDVDASSGTVVSTLGEDQSVTGSASVMHNFVQTSPDEQTILVAGSNGLEEFQVSNGMLTHVDPLVGKTAIQLIVSNNSMYLCAPDPAGNGSGTPLTTLLFDPTNVEAYYGSLSDPATPGPLAFNNDASIVYQIRFTGGTTELLVFDTTTFLETASVPLPTGDLSFTTTGRNTITLDRSGSLLFIGGSTTMASNAPGQLLAVASGVVGPPAINSALTASGMVGTAFTYQITATNSPTSFDATGLPDGLTVDPVAGLISGTPTTVGVYDVVISATNDTGTATATLEINITASTAGLTPVINNTSLPDGVIGQAYTATITATNSPTSFDATGLPAGLSIDTTTGIISGMPTVSGFYYVVVSATNSYGTGMATLGLTIATTTVVAPVITSATTASASVGAQFVYQITATNSPTSFDAGDLPKGLSVDVTTGLITGTPTTAGTFPVVLSATNAGGTGSANLTLTVSVEPTPSITSSTQGNAATGVAFSYQITATNNPTSFAASNLAPGLTIDPNTGLISGTPTTAGVVNITLNATNSTGTGSTVLLLSVTASPPVITSAATATAPLGQAFSYLITASNSPTSFAAAGLPPGLSVDATTGLIFGTPTTGGIYTVVISAANSGGSSQTNLTLTVVTVLPTVDIMTTVPRVTEGSGDQGAFTISRTGDTTGKLVVHYEVSGSASNGTDYNTIFGKVKIKPGQASASVLITPKDISSDGTVRTVKLVIAPSANYTVGTAYKAKVKIVPGS